jgi:2-methylcitrate dehydratase PrpD
MNESQTIARFVAGLRYEGIPPAVRDATRLFILDNLGCQLAGAGLAWSRTFYDVIRSTRHGGAATVVYYGDRLAPDDAAFLNSAFNHANESDDTHLKSPTHPGAVAVPAALAVAELAGAGGREFLTAVAAAYEVQIRIAWAASPHLIYRGHHPPPAVGPFGAATAAAVLLGLDAEHTLNALAIAGSHSGGLIEYTKTGGSVKRIHCAIPAQAGVRAALFAARGITGPATILEGDKGFFKVFAGQYDLARLTEGLGERWHLLDNALKPHSCCHLIHAAFDALDVIREREPLPPERVRTITVATNSEPILSHIGSIIEPTDVLGAQFSLPWSLALRLHRGGNGFWDYREEDLRDPALLATARKVRVVVAHDAEWEKVDEGAGIEVETVDGRRIRESVRFARGLPENPLSPDEVRRKFRSLVDPVLPAGRPAAIIDAVDGIAGLTRIDDLVRLLVVGEAGA